MHLAPVLTGLLLLAVPPFIVFFCYFLLCLGLLLVLSRPRTLSQWLWIGIAVLLVAEWHQLPASLFIRVTGASALFFAGALILATVAGVRSLVTRALLAGTGATVMVMLWLSRLGISYSAFRFTLTNEIWAFMRLSQPTLQLPEKLPASTGISITAVPASAIQQMADFTTTLSHFTGACLAVIAIGSAWLAWRSYDRLAATPLAPAAPPFRDFRFNDHFIWILIVLVALSLKPVIPWLTDLTANLLVVTLVFYAARGAAIIRSMMGSVAPLAGAIIAVVALLLLAPVLCGCVVLGVADTWFDLRRRLPPQGVAT